MTAAAAHPATILVIEDDESNLELVSAVLEQLGYGVTPARSAEEAWELLTAPRPDAVLADLRLPGQDGLAFARRLKADPETAAIPVLVLTAHGRPEEKAAALAAGCAEWLTKPLDTRLLARALSRVLSGL
jgi:two-component system, cell cycle response regulator